MFLNLRIKFKGGYNNEKKILITTLAKGKVSETRPVRLLSETFPLAKVVTLYTLGPFLFAFQLFTPIGKESGCTAPEFCSACAIRGTCPQEGDTYGTPFV